VPRALERASQSPRQTPRTQLGSTHTQIKHASRTNQQTNEQTKQKNKKNSLWLNATLGLVCVVAFSFLQRSFFPRHYRYRLVSESVTVKPRPLPTEGWSSLW